MAPIDGGDAGAEDDRPGDPVTGFPFFTRSRIAAPLARHGSTHAIWHLGCPTFEIPRNPRPLPRPRKSRVRRPKVDSVRLDRLGGVKAMRQRPPLESKAPQPALQFEFIALRTHPTAHPETMPKRAVGRRKRPVGPWRAAPPRTAAGGARPRPPGWSERPGPARSHYPISISKRERNMGSMDVTPCTVGGRAGPPPESGGPPDRHPRPLSFVIPSGGTHLIPALWAPPQVAACPR